MTWVTVSAATTKSMMVKLRLRATFQIRSETVRISSGDGGGDSERQSECPVDPPRSDVREKTREGCYD